jgi:tetratricopeptide (TPR) repeat protein
MAPSSQTDREMTMLKEIIAKDPGNVDAWIKLGNISMDSQRFQEAIHAYSEALKIDPGNVNVRVDMGTCYRNLGDPNKALEEYRKALQYNPNHPFAHKNLGIVLAFDLHRKEEAIKEFQTYLKLSPGAQDASQISQLVDELRKS